MTSNISREDILNQLNWRYACKKYDPTKKISTQDWNLIKESLRLAPSSYGLQPYKFVVVENADLRKKLRENSWGQSQVTDSSHFVVLVTREKMEEADVSKLINKTASVRGMSPDTLKGYHDMMVGDVVKGPRAQVINWWAQRQAYIAMGFALETAALLKVDTTALEGLDPAAYDKLLGLEGTGYKTVAAIAFGYRAADDGYSQAKKVRFDESDLFITK